MGKLKLSLLAGVAAVGLIAAGTSASAQGFLTQGSWTIKGFGGASFGQETTGSFRNLTDEDGDSFNESGKVKLDTGYTLGAGIGYIFGDAWGLGLEYGYRNSSVKSVNNGLGNGGRVTSNAFMLNGTYAFDNGGVWVPYVGLGFGIADLELKVDGGDADGKYKTDGLLAGQVFGGVGYEISPQTVLTGEIRYYGTEEKRFDGPGSSSVKYGYQSFDLLVGVAYRF